MKFTRLSNKIGSVIVDTIFALMILFMLGIAGVFVYIDFYLSTPIFSLMWIPLLPGLGLAINWFLGKFFDDKYYNTGLVNEGRSVYDVEKTPKYYTRRMFVCFVECFLFVLLIIRFVFLFHLSIASSIIGSIIGIVIYFIVGMSSYEQSSIKNTKPKKEEEPKIDKQVVEKNQLHKFKFDNYPELLEKYNSFKLWNSRKYATFENVEAKKQVLNEIDKSFESLAMAVYNTFNDIKPELIIKRTGEKVKWEAVIYKSFEELSHMEKLILVRLLDRLYKYVLPNNYYNL